MCFALYTLPLSSVAPQFAAALRAIRAVGLGVQVRAGLHVILLPPSGGNAAQPTPSCEGAGARHSSSSYGHARTRSRTCTRHG